MSAAAFVLLTAAAIIWLATPAYLVGAYVREQKADRADRARREQQEREVFPGWLADLSFDDVDPDADLTYQRMCFERWEAEL